MTKPPARISTDTRPKAKPTKYSDGVRVPKHANLAIFNAGYYLGVRATKESNPVPFPLVLLAFSSGYIQGVLKLFGWSVPRTARFLGISPATVRKHDRISEVTED